MPRAWLWALPPLGLIALMICDSKTPPPSVPSSPLPPVVPTGRAGVVLAAASQVGNGDPARYWADVAPGVVVQPHTEWCGGFALWALHQAGLALDRRWVFGKGFLLVGPHPLPTTKQPRPGDVAYFNKNQHEAIVESVTPAAIGLINGNGTGGKVSRSTVVPSAVTAFFSIEPLLAEIGRSANS